MKKIFTQFLAFTFSCLSIHSFAQVSFIANPNSGCAPLTVTFTNTSTVSGAYQYRWNFNDGTPLVNQNQVTTITHVYANRGTYQPSLSVYGVFGNLLGQYSASINVSGLGSNDRINLYPESVCPNQDISISAPWGYQNYVFSYGDGNSDTLTTSWKNYHYTSPGNYIVSVKILNVCPGFDTTLSDTVTVNSTMYFTSGGGPAGGGGLSLNNYPNQACPSENVSFYSGWGYASYIWNFGDGTTDTTTAGNINHNFSAIGNYPVSVKIFNYCGDDTTLYDTVTVRYTPFPAVSINSYTSFSSDAACPGEEVNFSAPWGYVYYVWNFGDGSPADSGNYAFKTHTYANTGTYIASLKIRQLCGNDTTVFDTIRVTNYVPFPTWVSINANPDPACPFKEINFYGPYGFPSYQWTWGDGTPVTTSSSSNTSHTYTSGGSYNISSTITNLCGNDTTLNYTVTIDSNLAFPTGTLFNVSSPSCPGKITLSASSHFQYFQWNYGDGTSEITTSSYTTHSYPSVGNYSVSVKLTDHCGQDTTVSQNLAIQYQPFPTSMQIGVYDDNSCPGEDIQFNAPWGYVSYQWNFGDGNTMTGSNYVNHSYASVGQYMVTVKVKQLCGNDTTLSKIVKVINNQSFPGGVSVNTYPDPVCPGEEVSFNGPWGFANYIWNFGDGILDTTTTPYTTHEYAAGGNFAAVLKLVNFCGLDTMLYDTVHVDTAQTISGASLNAWFPNGTSACPGEMVNFYASSYGYPNYTWDFGDGSAPLSGSFNFINYSYAEAGSYTATLTVENYCGNDTTVTKAITIDGNKPIGSMPYINVSPGYVANHCPGAPISFSGPSGYASYIWSFGDGTGVDSTTSNVTSHGYASPGNYTVSLKIINNCGNDTTSTRTVSISNTINPFTSINVYPNPICAGQEVVLKADTGFVSYYWNFGDGFSAYGTNNVNHSYSSMGTYQASVIITNYCNNSDTFSATITVDSTTSFPSWMGIWSGGGGAGGGACPGEITMLNTQPGFSSYFWNFGDGDTITSLGSTIGHVYDASGNYSASVTINNGCGNTTTLTTNISINTNSSVNPPNIYTAQNSYCPDDAVMFLLNDWGMGNAQNYTYYWDFGDGTMDTTFGSGANHVYDSAGSYTTIVTIMNMCGNSSTKIVPVKINSGTIPTLNNTMWGTLAQTGIVGCPGDAVVFYFEGTGENYWNFGDGSSGIASEEFVNDKGVVTTVIKHAFNAAGSYKVALTLTNGCGNSVSDTLNIQIMNNFLVDGGLILEPPLGTNAYTTCRELNFIAYGGSSYEWNFGDGNVLTTISPTVSHIYSQPGSYAVGVQITNECGYSTYFSSALSISQSGGPGADSVFSVDAACYGASSGTATVQVSGGEAPYTYLWSDDAAQSTTTATGLAAGTYSVTITDALGCDIDTAVTVGEASKIELATSATATACGSSSGSALVTVAGGGNPGFSYSWSNGASVANPSGLSAGTYTVTVTDADGCSATAMAAVSDIGGPALTVNSITNVTCNGNSNGSINTTASGSNSPFTFIWSNGKTTDDISSISAGDYIVTVTDTAGCKTVDIITLSQPDALSLKFSFSGTECGEANGSASVAVSGGTPGYSYLWDSNAGSKIISSVNSLSANAYRVTVTDANSCSSVGVVTINNSNAPSLSLSKTNISCPGIADGAINLSVSKGTTPYSFIWSWSGGSSFIEDLSGLSPGVYTVMVQDASNCWVGTSVTLTAPSYTTKVSVTDASCIGSSNGSAAVVANGGASPYSYLWSNSSTGSSVNNLSAGTYIVEVTDTNNCTVTDTAVISQPSALGVTLAGTNVSCYGGSNGTATASVSGGSTPYTYAWSNGSTSSSINVLSQGKYYVTISDSCGTSKLDSITISQPSQLVATISKTDVKCYGGGDGIATVSVTGGTSPYNYSWNNGQSTATAYGLFPAFHSVNVFDANGCLSSNNVTITQPLQLAASSSVTPVSCYNGTNGSVDVSVSGGTAPYTYTWSNNLNTQDASGLSAGSYSVTITDSCGISSIHSMIITQPSQLGISKSVSNVSCNGYLNGQVNLTVSGGVSPYSYNWSNGASAEDISSLAPGWYYVTVTDACSLSFVDSALISQPASLTTTVSKTNVNCFGYGDGSATIVPSGGTSPYTYNWNNGQNTQTAIGLFPGSYSVNVVDAKGCISLGLVDITQPQQLSASSTASSVSCYAGNDGSVTISVSGGTSPYSFFWSNSETTEDVSGLTAGSYSVTITDSCNAIITKTVEITEPSVLSLSKTVTHAKCFGVNDGSVTLYPAGGVSPYSYAWSNGAATKNISGLTPGIYYVTVSDACSQSYIDSALINQPTALSAAIIKNDVSCNGLGNGSATVTANGGTAPFTYSWSNGQHGQTAVGLFPGNYNVNVVDSNGCLATALTSINQPQALSATSSVSYVSCYAGSDGSVNITVNGGTSPYSFLWSTSETSEDLSGLTAGSYFVTITDSCGSAITQSVQVTQPGALSLSKTIFDVKCNGASNGSVNLTASGGVLPYTYAWSNGASTEDLTNVNAGIYYVTVTDGCGQTGSDSSIVNQPSILSSSVTKTNVSCYGAGNGSASVQVSGGTSPYTYSWNNGQSFQTVQGLFPGNYSVNIFDVNGCYTSNSVNISQPQQLSATVNLTNVTCYGGNDGAANLTVSGGTAPYSYTWSNDSLTEDVSGLDAGSYSVSVTDSCGTVVVQTVQVSQPGPLTVLKTKNDVSCNGVNDGSANLSVSGGVNPYSYLWSNNATDEDLSSLSPGNYYVTVSDACSQLSIDSVMITEPDALNASITKTNVSCYGLGNGTATVTVSGGTGPYIYQWNNTQNTSTASGLFPGLYSVNVFDANNCMSSNSIFITQPAILSLTINATKATCGNADALANSTVSGGTSPYTYIWSNNDTNPIATGLAPGTIELNVTDVNGCTVSESDVVGTFVPEVEMCVVTVDTSNTKNLIVWQKPMANYIDSFRIYRDIVGTYTLIGSVSYDDLSKFVDYSFGINPSVTSYRYKISAVDTCGNESALSAVHKTMHLTSNLGTQGEVNLIWDGYDGFGLANFYYRILRKTSITSGYEVIDSVSNLNFTYTDDSIPQGIVSYIVEVVHPFGGCLATKAVENHNSSRSNRSQSANGAVLSAFTVTTEASSETSCDGDATVIASGGVSPYSYLWDTAASGQNTATATGLCAGTYNVTVTDDLGNSFVTYATVDVQVGITEGPDFSTVNIYPNPGKGLFFVQSSEKRKMEITVFNILGEIVFRSTLKEPGSLIDLRVFGSGVYSLQLTVNGVSAYRRIIIE